MKGNQRLNTTLAAGLTAALLDICGAIIVYAFIIKVTTPQRLLQSVASGALGKSAFSGGWQTALAGLGFHTLIALIFAGFYALIFPFWRKLFSNKLFAGIMYGCFVWCIMNLAVVPLATAKAYTYNTKFFLTGIGLIIFMVGIPIVFITEKYLASRTRKG